MQSFRQEPSTILFTHYGEDWIRGSERCLLDLISHLDRDRFRPIVWCNNPTLASELRDIDVPVIESDFPLLLGWQKPRFAVLEFFKLIRLGIKLVDACNVSLIHANSGAPSQWLNLVARARNIPLLTHLHSPYPLRDRVTLGLHQVSKVVGVSLFVIDQLLQDGKSPQRCCVIPNGIDTERLDLEPRINLRWQLRLKRRDFLVATTGSLIHRKGMDLIIESISRLVKRGIPAHLAIIGDGPRHLDLQRQSQQLGIEKQVHFLGEQSNVAGLLRGGVDLFVSAAREEAFGLVLAEASLSQLPIVAPAIGGIPEIVIDGKTGQLIPAGDVDALTHNIYLLYVRPELRKSLGQAGRRHILGRFSIRQNVQRFTRLYGQMLQNPGMQMRWHSHWEVIRPIKNICRQLFALTLVNLTVRKQL